MKRINYNSEAIEAAKQTLNKAETNMEAAKKTLSIADFALSHAIFVANAAKIEFKRIETVCGTARIVLAKEEQKSTNWEMNFPRIKTFNKPNTIS